MAPLVLLLLGFSPCAMAMYAHMKDLDKDGILEHVARGVSLFESQSKSRNIVAHNTLRGSTQLLRSVTSPAKTSTEPAGPGIDVNVQVNIKVNVGPQNQDGSSNEATDVNPAGSFRHVDIQRKGPTTFIADHAAAGNFSTAALSQGHIKSGKVYYEARIRKIHEECESMEQIQIGWAADGWLESSQKEFLNPAFGVGDDALGQSFGFDPLRMGELYRGLGVMPIGVMPWKDSKIPVASEGSIVGIAINLDDGKAFFGVDGNWAEGFYWTPGPDCVRGVFPAWTAICVEIELELRPTVASRRPPGADFVAFADASEPMSSGFAEPFTCEISYPKNVELTFDESQPWPPKN